MASFRHPPTEKAKYPPESYDDESLERNTGDALRNGGDDDDSDEHMATEDSETENKTVQSDGEKCVRGVKRFNSRPESEPTKKRQKIEHRRQNSSLKTNIFHPSKAYGEVDGPTQQLLPGNGLQIRTSSSSDNQHEMDLLRTFSNTLLSLTTQASDATKRPEDQLRQRKRIQALRKDSQIQKNEITAQKNEISDHMKTIAKQEDAINNQIDTITTLKIKINKLMDTIATQNDRINAQEPTIITQKNEIKDIKAVIERQKLWKIQYEERITDQKDKMDIQKNTIKEQHDTTTAQMKVLAEKGGRLATLDELDAEDGANTIQPTHASQFMLSSTEQKTLPEYKFIKGDRYQVLTGANNGYLKRGPSDKYHWGGKWWEDFEFRREFKGTCIGGEVLENRVVDIGRYAYRQLKMADGKLRRMLEPTVKVNGDGEMWISEIVKFEIPSGAQEPQRAKQDGHYDRHGRQNHR